MTAHVIDLINLPEESSDASAIVSQLASTFHRGSAIARISAKTVVTLNTFGPISEPQKATFRDLAAHAYQRMILRSENQALLFLGESGTGKTVFKEVSVDFLLSQANNPISARISSAIRVFSAFTTAKTAESLQTSRAGQLLELQYSDDATLIGASLSDYRLERSRVAQVPTGERNYHVFYQLLFGLNETEKLHLCLNSDLQYRFLGYKTQIKFNPQKDSEDFRTLLADLRCLGFSRTDIANICQLLAAILHIGELQFKSVPELPSGAQCEATNYALLERIAGFLGVRTELLENCLSFKSVIVARERVTRVLDCNGARGSADDLARCLYALLFSWIMEKVNLWLSQKRNSEISSDPASEITSEIGSDIASVIAIVDFPGFSTSETIPTIDKLLHNAGNEYFTRFLLSAYFDKPAQKLESEEISVPPAEYFDNADVVTSLFRPKLGLLSVVDDFSRRGKRDASLLESIRRRYHKHDFITAPRHKTGNFLIRHYAGEVEYRVSGLLASNMEAISGDFIRLFTSASTSDFLRVLFASRAVVTETGESEREIETPFVAKLSSKPTREASLVRKATLSRARTQKLNKPDSEPNLNTTETISASASASARADACGQFASALHDLVESLNTANVYFALCIKPNDRRICGQIDARCVRQQIMALQVPEIVRRVQNVDFGMFLTYPEFFRLLPENPENPENSENAESDKTRAEAIIRHHRWKSRDIRAGITGIVISEPLWRELSRPETTRATVEAALRGVKSTNMELSDYADNGNFGYLPGNNRLNVGESTDIFKFTDTKSNYGPSLMHLNTELSTNPQISPDSTTKLNQKASAKRTTWLGIVRTLTGLIPEAALLRLGQMPRRDVRTAWREKLAINFLIWLFCGAMVVFLIFFPVLVCPKQAVFSPGELAGHSFTANPKKTYVAIRGTVFDLTEFAPSHYPSVVPQSSVLSRGGADASDLFPIQVSALCSGVSGEVSPYVVLGTSASSEDASVAQYHDFRFCTSDYRPNWYGAMMQRFNKQYRVGYIGYTPKDVTQKLVKDEQRVVGRIRGNVYDLTAYVSGDVSVAAPKGQKTPQNVDTEFLASEIVALFQSHNGQDISAEYAELPLDAELRHRMDVCLDNLFFIGKVDTRDSVRCQFARYFPLAISCLLVAVIGFKFAAALQFSRQKTPEISDKFVICQVPAYTEGANSVRRAIDSLARANYDDRRKLLFVICDGVIVGAENDQPTPRIVLDVLGAPPEADAPPLSFESVAKGVKRHNRGKVFTGLYSTNGHIVPWVVVVKVGTSAELSRPGNRGKRDSQLLLMRFLHRVHFDLPMAPLELELYHQLRHIVGVDPRLYELLLQVDADTAVAQEAPAAMVSAMAADSDIIGLCGETEVHNADTSFVTMIQVYEYYISHNFTKAFESLFGCVTCLPGCFSMFRLIRPDGEPMFVSNAIVQAYAQTSVDTLHEKNLLELGEDRYLTTLMLKHFPRAKTKYLSGAKCNTIVPETFKVFLSQRRRWINSTVHNLVELVAVPGLCGFCCFSMRFVVILDLISTIVQPVVMVYLVYLVYLIASSSESVPVTSIVMIAAVYGLQALVFLLRRRWEMIVWMLIYLAALPVFAVALPLYSFWNMDDFSWGNTRVVLGEKGEKRVIVPEEGEFDESEIPLQRWSEFQEEDWVPLGGEGGVAESSGGLAGGAAEGFVEYRDGIKPNSATTSSLSEFANTRGYHAELAMAARTFVSENSTETPIDRQPLLPERNVSDSDIIRELKDILATSDLMQVTKRSIRAELEKRLQTDLGSRREFIKIATEAILKGEL